MLDESDANECHRFFGPCPSDCPGTVDGHFIQYVSNWCSPRSSIIVNMLKKYDGSYSPKFRKSILQYVYLVIIEPDLVNQKREYNGPSALIPLIVTHRAAVSDLIAQTDSVDVIVKPILARINHSVNMANVERYDNVLSSLAEVEKVMDALSDARMWDVRVEGSLGVNDAVFDFGTPSAVRSASPTPPDGGRGSFFDGFLEVFFYGKSDRFCPLTLGKTTAELHEMTCEEIPKMRRHHQMIHGMLMKIIKKRPEIKRNFIAWLHRVCKMNENRIKMVSVRCSSDGFCFNLNGVLTIFVDKVVQSGVTSLSSEFLDDAPDYGAMKFGAAVFYAKAIVCCYTYIKMLESVDELEFQLAYSRDPHLKSILDLYKVILASELVEREKSFIEYLGTWISGKLDEMERDGRSAFDFPVMFIKLYLMMVDYNVSTGGASLFPNARLLNRLLGSGIDLHDKLPVLKLIIACGFDCDLETLFKMYVRVDKIEEKNSFRFYLNMILSRDSISESRLCYALRSARGAGQAHGADAEADGAAGISLPSKFISCVISDLEQLLSMGLGTLADIRGSHNPREIRKAKWCFACLDELFKLIDKLLGIIKGSRMLPQFVTVLNYNVKLLVGPRCSELKIKEDVGFKPREFLRRIVKFYLGLHVLSSSQRQDKQDDLLDLVVHDRMNYSLKLFKRCYQICESKAVLSDNELSEFSGIVAALAEIKVGEDVVVPDEFIDPVTCLPMENPVKLRTSKVTIDKSTYEMLMLSTGIDPFSREPLSGYDEDTELSEKIRAYILRNGSH